MTDRAPEPRVASHDDDPAAPLADRLLLALGMWPSYAVDLGADEVVEAAVIIRTAAHRYPMVAEDYGHKADLLYMALHHLRAIIHGPEGEDGIDNGRQFLEDLDEGAFDVG